jgi:NAD(P)-dependent dehydrogenase (short-subunit alcohol dehydrogenase family)
MAIDLSPRTVIVTGAARGLGRAMSLGLARAGARVAACDLISSASELRDLPQTEPGLADRIIPLACDVTDFRDCAAAVTAAIDRFGAVHGLVNNAAIGMQNIGRVLSGTKKRFFEVDAHAWRDAIDTNVNGPFNMAKAIAPALVQQGWGRIVNIVTSYFTMQMEGFSPYGPSKGALEAATVVWSKDIAGSGVTVNALLPGGPANTRMIPLAEVPDRATLIQPETMVAPLLWLMSTQSDSVTGRRFTANEWDSNLDPRLAAEKAGAPAGWYGA